MLAPRIPVIVLAYNNDAELARSVICHGAKAYIPVTMGFEIAIATVRFVLAGGTYAPMDCLLPRDLQRDPPGDALSQPPRTGLVTNRELAVIQAIQKGKSNKVIAYDLNLCESTVKVHVRNIMRKLKAKNRTDVAIKAQPSLASLSRSEAAPGLPAQTKALRSWMGPVWLLRRPFAIGSGRIRFWFSWAVAVSP